MPVSKNKNMMLLIKKWLPKIVIVVAIIAICSVLFEKCSSNASHKAFLVEMDSLHKVNDSLFAEIKKDDAVIDSLNYVSEELTYKVEHQKAKVIRIVETVEVEKSKVDTFTEHELISSFNTRYPKDTITNPNTTQIIFDKMISLNRAEGYNGEVLFYYETIKDARKPIYKF
jgi:hypothetical protein